MTESERSRSSARSRLEKHVAGKQKRKVRARETGEDSAWFGLGMFGLIGWSVVLPALAGVAIGLWIDSQWPSRLSWTLMLMVMGVAVGCLNAWWWLQREGHHNQDQSLDKEEDNNV